MELKEADKIVVLDPIHGAEVIAAELKELGKEVAVYNPYRESLVDTFSGLRFDLVIAPVHLSPEFEMVKEAVRNDIPFMSHHEAVKEIADMNRIFAGINVVEVTGTSRKTSVCELICQLVKPHKVLSHTSSATRFISDGAEIQFPRLSGTPASVLKAMRIAREKNVDPDIAVFEVSLGLTGAGDVGVITSLEEDYMIAGGTKAASAVKKASIRSYEGKAGSVVVHSGLSDVDGNTYGDKDKNLWIAGAENKVVFNGLRTINGAFVRGELAFAPFESYLDVDYYRHSLEAACCAVLSLGIAPEVVNTSNVSAVTGRMKLEKVKGRFLIDNSNSGTKLQFLDEIIEMGRRFSERMILIAGMESQYVCEGVDVAELKKVVESRASDFVEIIIVGAEFRDKIAGVLFYDRLDAALEKAVNDSEEGFVIISNVKTWR